MSLLILSHTIDVIPKRDVCCIDGRRCGEGGVTRAQRPHAVSISQTQPYSACILLADHEYTESMKHIPSMGWKEEKTEVLSRERDV